MLQGLKSYISERGWIDVDGCAFVHVGNNCWIYKGDGPCCVVSNCELKQSGAKTVGDFIKLAKIRLEDFSNSLKRVTK